MSCGTAKDLIRVIRQQLHDECPAGADESRYTDAFILDRINLSLLALFALRPDAFEPKVKYFDLIPGTDQQLPENFHLMEVLGSGYYDADGKPIDCSQSKPAESNQDFLSAYSSVSIPASAVAASASAEEKKCAEYSVTSFAYDPKNGRYFTASPAVPAGSTIKIKVLVSECPSCSPESLDYEIPCKWYSTIYEKTMAYVLSAEDEDAANMAKAAGYETRFAEMQKAIYQRDAQIGSGYYRGRKPDGSPDERVRRG